MQLSKRSPRSRSTGHSSPRRVRGRRGSAAALLVGGALTLALTGSASGGFSSAEIGSLPTDEQLETCGAAGATGFDLVQTSTSADVRYEVPDAGVITSWRYRGASGLATQDIRLQIWRAISGADFALEGRSDPELVIGSSINEFSTRIPVTAGSLLGLRSISIAGCVSDDSFSPENSVLARFPGSDPAVGATVTMNSPPSPMRRLNIAATIEPDADGDGFGDESQDVGLTTKLKNKLGAKGSGFPVRIACGGSECEATVSGKAVAKRKGGKSAGAAKAQKFKLKPKTISIAADVTEKTTLKLKKHGKSSRKLSRLLKSDRAYRKGSKLKLKVLATNSLGDSDKLKDKAKLKP